MNKTTTHTASINGYRVTLEVPSNPSHTTQCHVERGRYSASLEAAKAGTLTDASGNEHSIGERDTDAIEAWALANGY